MRKAGIRLAVIDTPPAITQSITRVVAHADLVVVPTRPSPHDLRAVGATVDIAERNQKPLIFVINAATARARITGEARWRCRSTAPWRRSPCITASISPAA